MEIEMRKSTFSRVIKIYSAIAIIIASANIANAYSILDHAELELRLPENWKLIDIARNSDSIITSYTKYSTEKKLEGSLVEVQLKKSNNSDPAMTIQEMSTRLKKQAIDQHCEADDTVTLPQDSDALFRVWSQTFQCKQSRSGIIQFYIDVDPTTMYLFTYTVPYYPFSPSMRDTANNVLKSAIHICYKGKECSALN
jgi:hypothetical protein